jgi:hypothetical protein
LYYEWGHSLHHPLPPLTVGPEEEKEYYFEAEFPQYMSKYLDIRASFNLRYKTDPDEPNKASQKGFRVKGIQTISTLKFNSDRQLAPGGPFNYSIQSNFVSTPLPGDSTIKLALEKYSRESNQYEELKILKEEAHDFYSNGDFQFTGTYTPETVHPYGSYRLKLEVTTPNGIKEQARYQSFSYDRSRFFALFACPLLSFFFYGKTSGIPVSMEPPTNTTINHSYPAAGRNCRIFL